MYSSCVILLLPVRSKSEQLESSDVEGWGDSAIFSSLNAKFLLLNEVVGVPNLFPVIFCSTLNIEPSRERPRRGSLKFPGPSEPPSAAGWIDFPSVGVGTGDRLILPCSCMYSRMGVDVPNAISSTNTLSCSNPPAVFSTVMYVVFCGCTGVKSWPYLYIVWRVLIELFTYFSFLIIYIIYIPKCVKLGKGLNRENIKMFHNLTVFRRAKNTYKEFKLTYS